MLPRIASIAGIIDESRTVKTFVMNDAVEAQPGQFLMVWLPGQEEKPLSIAWPDPLTLTVARVGPFSTALHGCQVGDKLGWRGPFGRGFTLPERGPVLLVGGGYGSAPLLFLAREATQRDMETIVALGARRADDLILVNRFQKLGCRVILATDDGSRGFHGLVTAAIATEIERVTGVFACGPEPMLVALAEICREKGVPGQLSLERYMKCGFGICGQCALDDRLVCQDGPVFTVEELATIRDFGRFRRSATGRRLELL